MAQDNPDSAEKIAHEKRSQRAVNLGKLAGVFVASFILCLHAPANTSIWFWVRRPDWLTWVDAWPVTAEGRLQFLLILGFIVGHAVWLILKPRRNWAFDPQLSSTIMADFGLYPRPSFPVKAVLLIGFPDEVKVHLKGAEVSRVSGAWSLLNYDSRHYDLIVFYPNPHLFCLPQTHEERHELLQEYQRSLHLFKSAQNPIVTFQALLDAALCILNSLAFNTIPHTHIVFSVPGKPDAMDPFTRRVWSRWIGMRWPGHEVWRDIPLWLWPQLSKRSYPVCTLRKYDCVLTNSERSVIADIALDHFDVTGLLVPATIRPPSACARVWRRVRRAQQQHWQQSADSLLESLNYKYPGIFGLKLNPYDPMELTASASHLDIGRGQTAPPISIKTVISSRYNNNVPVALEIRYPSATVHLLPELHDVGSFVETIADMLYWYGIRRYRPGLTAEAPDRDCFAPDMHLRLPRWRKAWVEVERVLKHKPPDDSPPRKMVGRSAAFLAMFPGILDAIRNPLEHVLVYGPTGSGKELIYETLRLASADRGKFVIVDMARSEGTWVNSEIFGYVQGAFSGATANHPGLIEKAASGTLVLDNVQNATGDLQAKILRLLEPKQEYRPLGSNEIKKAECRIVAGFNLEPRELVKAGKLLPDWLARFGIEIVVPPLDNRTTDIPLLVKNIARDYSAEFNVNVESVLKDLLADFGVITEWEEKSWAEEEGNVRGLRKKVRRLLRDRLAGEYPDTDRLAAVKSFSIWRPDAKDPDTDRLAAVKSFSDWLAAVNPDTDRQAVVKSFSNWLSAEDPDTDRLAAVISFSDWLVAENPDTYRLAAVHPDTDRLAEEAPDTDRLAEEDRDIHRRVAKYPKSYRQAAVKSFSDWLASVNPDTDRQAVVKSFSDWLSAEDPDTYRLAAVKSFSNWLSAEDPDTDRLTSWNSIFHSLFGGAPDTDRPAAEAPDTYRLAAVKFFSGWLARAKRPAAENPDTDRPAAEESPPPGKPDAVAEPHAVHNDLSPEDVPQRKGRGRPPDMPDVQLKAILQDAADKSQTWDDLRRVISKQPSNGSLHRKGLKVLAERVNKYAKFFGDKIMNYVRDLQAQEEV